MTNIDYADLLESHKSAVADIMRTSTALRLTEKEVEQHKKTIENLEKIRDQQKKTAVEDAATVINDCSIVYNLLSVVSLFHHYPQD